jgi:hypothetical protein
MIDHPSERASNDHSPFNFSEINCQEITEPFQTCLIGELRKVLKRFETGLRQTSDVSDPSKVFPIRQVKL